MVTVPHVYDFQLAVWLARGTVGIELGQGRLSVETAARKTSKATVAYNQQISVSQVPYIDF